MKDYGVGPVLGFVAAQAGLLADFGKPPAKPIFRKRAKHRRARHQRKSCLNMGGSSAQGATPKNNALPMVAIGPDGRLVDWAKRGQGARPAAETTRQSYPTGTLGADIFEDQLDQSMQQSPA